MEATPTPSTYLSRSAAVALIRAGGVTEAEDVEFFLTMSFDGYGYLAADLRADVAAGWPL